MERRDANRVEFTARGEIDTAAGVVSGRVENLSLSGFFLHTQQMFELEQLYPGRILLSGDSDGAVISGKCRAARQTAEGFGFKFVSLDLDSFAHLRNAVAYNEASLEEADEDFHRFLKHNLEQ